MSHVETFESLLNKRVQEIKPGLERMQAAYKLMGLAQSKTATLLVGGTNGKGSTSALLFALLGGSGRIGLYTSPHLISFRERFASSTETTSDERLVAIFDQVKKSIPVELYDELSFFEVITLMAFRLFAEQNSQCNILEVGMGGRWDATNIVDPLASVIVSIGHDHQAYLGHSLAAILGEKLGIIRKGLPLFTGTFENVLADDEARSVITNRVSALGVSWWRLGEHFTRTGMNIDIALPGIRRAGIAIPSLFQYGPIYLLDNLAVACAVYHWMAEHSSLFPALQLPPLEAAIAHLLDSRRPGCATLLGRFMRVTAPLVGRPRRLLFDVCHNVDGALAFREALAQKLGTKAIRRLPGLVSILRDKEIDPMLDILKGILAPLVVFKIDHDRSLDEENLHPRHGDVPVFDSFAAAARHLANESQDDVPWVVCGSVLAIGKVLEEIDLKLDGLAIDRVLGGDWHFPL